MLHSRRLLVLLLVPILGLGAWFGVDRWADATRAANQAAGPLAADPSTTSPTAKPSTTRPSAKATHSSARPSSTAPTIQPRPTPQVVQGWIENVEPVQYYVDPDAPAPATSGPTGQPSATTSRPAPTSAATSGPDDDPALPTPSTAPTTEQPPANTETPQPGEPEPTQPATTPPASADPTQPDVPAPEATDDPTENRAPEASQSPKPSTTPAVTDTPTGTALPSVTPTPTPSATPTPTSSATPTPTPSATPTPTPTPTPEPSEHPSPEPSGDPSPQPSPEPTEEPSEEHTEEPSEEPASPANRSPELVSYDKVSAFINAVAPMAQETQREYGVPASVTLAQAILESGWGGSTLSRYGQAYFGVKCSSNNGPYVTNCVQLPTWEVINGQNVTVMAYFRSYQSLTDSILDHGHFLRNNSRYAPAFRTSDPREFARAIHAAGYATDPQYANKLISLIDYNGLERFDRGELAGTVPVINGIGARYDELGGVNGPLGTAVGIESDGPVAGSRLVSFDTGVIIWTEEHGSHAITGAIWDHYRLDPNVRSRLGAPTTDEMDYADGTIQYFQGGSIYNGPSGAKLSN